MFHITMDSSKGLKETIESVTEKLKEEQFGVQWVFNVNEKLSAKGFELGSQYRILEVCNPKEAHRVLSRNPLASYFLPCKIVVYSDKSGKVKVGMPKPTALITMTEDDHLKDIAADIENRLVRCIQSSL
ncbi:MULTISPECIES: DUF302 domain-containing protein [unclassified Sporolactobacillus]|uniref:DUF302 domain-containing protein n=1 Tax=unclassified Sporolactobacillus TaxID=2628533 RepID=UPI002368130D|nr:DUF302 domain-containing protein [Sporolactobacillus sp. CQH2019]MDD9150256.1 DUF302 domain-containing protein [Sporolactobacillus sp. CQH2019]